MVPPWSYLSVVASTGVTHPLAFSPHPPAGSLVPTFMSLVQCDHLSGSLELAAESFSIAFCKSLHTNSLSVSLLFSKEVGSFCHRCILLGWRVVGEVVLGLVFPACLFSVLLSHFRVSTQHLKPRIHLLSDPAYHPGRLRPLFHPLALSLGWAGRTGAGSLLDNALIPTYPWLQVQVAPVPSVYLLRPFLVSQEGTFAKADPSPLLPHPPLCRSPFLSQLPTLGTRKCCYTSTARKGLFLFLLIYLVLRQ